MKSKVDAVGIGRLLEDYLLVVMIVGILVNLPFLNMSAPILPMTVVSMVMYFIFIEKMKKFRAVSVMGRLLIPVVVFSCYYLALELIFEVLLLWTGNPPAGPVFSYWFTAIFIVGNRLYGWYKGRAARQ